MMATVYLHKTYQVRTTFSRDMSLRSSSNHSIHIKSSPPSNLSFSTPHIAFNVAESFCSKIFIPYPLKPHFTTRHIGVPTSSCQKLFCMSANFDTEHFDYTLYNQDLILSIDVTSVSTRAFIVQKRLTKCFLCC